MNVNRRQVTAGLAGALVGAVAMPRIGRAQGEPIRLQLNAIPVFGGLGKVVADKSPDVKDWIGISNDQQANIDLSHIFLNSVKAALAEKGVTANMRELVLSKQGAGDFRSQIATLAGSGATGILNSLVGSDSLTFYKQAKSFGLDQKVRVF